VAQDLVVTEIDCGTTNGLSIHSIVEGGTWSKAWASGYWPRRLEDVVAAASGEVLVKAAF